MPICQWNYSETYHYFLWILFKQMFCGNDHGNVHVCCMFFVLIIDNPRTWYHYCICATIFITIASRQIIIRWKFIRCEIMYSLNTCHFSGICPGWGCGGGGVGWYSEYIIYTKKGVLYVRTHPKKGHNQKKGEFRTVFLGIKVAQRGVLGAYLFIYYLYFYLSTWWGCVLAGWEMGS